MPKFRDMPYSVQLVWIMIGIIAVSVVGLTVASTIGTAVFAIFL